MLLRTPKEVVIESVVLPQVLAGGPPVEATLVESHALTMRTNS